MKHSSRRAADCRVDTRATWPRIALCLAALAVLLPNASGAQQGRALVVSANVEGASRAELRQLVTRVESLANTPGLTSSDRAQALFAAGIAKARLESGDFDVGDRIAVLVKDHPTLSDTFVVRAGRRLSLPTLAELELVGVLRSELQACVTAHVAQY